MATAVVPARVPLEVREPLLQRYTSALPSAQAIHGPRPYMEPHLPRLTAVDATALLRKHPGLPTTGRPACDIPPGLPMMAST